MRRIDNASVQFFIGIVFRLFVADGLHFSGIAGFFLNLFSLQDCTSVLGNLRLDSIYTATHIYSVDYTLSQCIVDNDIVVEEFLCFFNRSCCQSYKSGRVEIFQNLSPIPVNGTVTLIYDNHIKVIVWQIGIGRQRNFFCRFIVVIVIIIFDGFSFQKREKTLYR